MRDKNLKFIQFTDQIESFLKKETHTIEILRRAVVDSPTLLLEDFKIILNNNKLSNLRGLAIISYYIPEILGWKIRGYLEEYSRKLSLKDREKLLLLCHSKEATLVFLYETQEFSSHEIFGNVLRNGLRTLRSMKIIKVKYKLKKPQRKRGYDDKGSLRSSDRWLPSFDYTLTELQNEINKRNSLHKRKLHYLENYLYEKYFYLKKNSK